MTRNRLHYSPRRHWMNDPNGLVFHNGRYHLYYQYNPYGVDPGNMCWGHASSTDLITWEEHPVAIWCNDEEEIYSGSVVVDVGSTSGFGTPERPAFIALYTSLSKETRNQAQSLAYSLDEGMTWTKFQGNPVLDRDSTQFRDPKVIRWDGPDESYWVMVAVEADRQEVHFYRSEDLLAWRHLSVFGPEGAIGGLWECPDLFPLRVEASGERCWVLLVSIYPGGVAGGSGTQYFVGVFDGQVFIPEERSPLVSGDDDEGLRELSWLDHGRDCYAGVTFSGLAEADRTLIAWMSNWDYARTMPAEPSRGTMTLARRLSLVEVRGRRVLRQEPVLPRTTWYDCGETVIEGIWRVPISLASAVVVDLTVHVGDATGVEARLRHEEDGTGGVVVRFDTRSQEVRIDRAAVADGIDRQFAGVDRAVRWSGSQRLSLRIVLDARTIELFADDGVVTLTDLVRTADGASGLSIAAVGGTAVIESLRIGSFAEVGLSARPQASLPAVGAAGVASCSRGQTTGIIDTIGERP